VALRVAFTNPHGALIIEIKDNLGFLRSTTLPDQKEIEFVPN
jgi:hypothetical protein